jgi:HEAT repeat protein
VRTKAALFLLVCALTHPSAAQVTLQNPGGRAGGARTPILVGPPGSVAHAGPVLSPSTLPSPLALTSSHGLRDHFGIDLAAHLLRSGAPDERLRGLARAAAIGTPEAISLLIHAAKEPERLVGPDTRALLITVRGLADATNQSEVRSFLKDSVLNATLHQRPATSSAEPDAEDGDRNARLTLARSEAAFALATSSDPKAVETVMLVARDPGPGQAAAAEAVTAYPPERVAAIGTGLLSPTLLHLAAAMGDLRTLDAVRAALHSTESETRAAALAAIAALGDTRAIADARTMFKDADPLVRVAAAGALVRLGAPDRFRAVESMIGDDETAREGVRLAGLAADAGVVHALAARVKASGEAELRALAIAALGQAGVVEAVEALSELIKDPSLEGDAASALARNPNPRSAAAIELLVRSESRRRLGARAYTLRTLTRGSLSRSQTDWGTTALVALSSSKDTKDRAVGLGGLVLLGLRNPIDALADPDRGVRQVVATAAMAYPTPETARALLALSRSEPDPLVRKVERAALALGDREGRVTTLLLAERTRAGESDAPLCTMALAARGDPDYEDKVDALLASGDPIVRAHAARGLGASPSADAIGRLAEAMTFEVDPLVRRAIVGALAERTRDEDAPSRLLVLKKAARLDPDRAVRDTAARAVAGRWAEARPPAHLELAWLRLATATGAAPLESGGGLLLRSDGLAVPIAFDPEGYALVPIPPGEARLLLEPRIPVYDGARHE